MKTNKIQMSPRNLSSTYLFKTLFTRDYIHQFSSVRLYLALFFELIPIAILLFPIVSGGPMFFQAHNYVNYESALSPLTTLNIRFLIPLIAFLFGANMISDEIEHRTLTYLTSRPLSRPLLFLSKLTSAVAMVSSVTVISYFIYSIIAFTYYDLPDYPYDFPLVTIGLILYCWAITAIFATLSAIFPHNSAACLIYFVLVEFAAGWSKSLSIFSTSTTFIQLIQQIQRNLIAQGVINKYVGINSPASSDLSEFAALVTIFVIASLATLIGTTVFSKRNYLV